MTQLVEVFKDGIYCDSHVLARKFGQKHKEVVKRIKKLEKDLSEIRGVSNPPGTIQENRTYQGTEYISYLMSREFFSLLMMRFRGIKALEWQIKFNDAFYQMERKLLTLTTNEKDQEWVSKRKQGKIARKEETDIIKKFIAYATRQGSKSAKFYYKHYTNATYKALGLIQQKKPKLRDTLNLYEVSELLLAERVARDSIKKYMDLERNYKDIYTSVKKDLIQFGKSLRLE